MSDACRISLGGQEAVIAPVGAKLCQYRVNGADAVVGFEPGATPPAFNGAVLAPWPNRLRDGVFTWDGVRYQLPITEPDRMTALHGLMCWHRWGVVDRDAASVTLGLDLPPQPGWPFRLRLEVRYALSNDGLAIEVVTSNLGQTALPYGVGFHPWLSTGGASLDDCTLQLDAATHIVADERLLPAGAEPVAGAYDLRRPSSLAGLDLDDAWADALPDASGRAWGCLARPDGRSVCVWMQAPLTCWQVCTGDHIDGFRRVGVAVEPMTCLADAFTTGEHLIRLEAGSSHRVRWGIQMC